MNSQTKERRQSRLRVDGEAGSMRENRAPRRLRWRQSSLAWLAHLPDSAEFRGDRLVNPVRADVRQLCRCLLGISGEMVCVPFPESPAFCRILLQTGQVVCTSNPVMVDGEPNECHLNAALVCSYIRSLAYMTGYALSDDRMWRRHSWALTPDSRIVETTCRQELYFGVIAEIGG